MPTLVFPVVGAVQYRDDFGEPRGGGSHEGNDLMAAKGSIAVATEAGRVTFWTTSASAGCMLYLHGDSGTTYLYIHLNNDLTSGNDNRGKCVAGTAYAPGLKDGARVAAGQQVGYVGDSGDANGVGSHLHFELHPNDGGAVDPYPYLQAAKHLLFYAKPRTKVSLDLTGSVVSTANGQLDLKVATVHTTPANVTVALNRRVVLNLAIDTRIETTAGVPGVPTVSATLEDARKGQPVTVTTKPVTVTAALMLGNFGSLTLATVVLG